MARCKHRHLAYRTWWESVFVPMNASNCLLIRSSMMGLCSAVRVRPTAMVATCKADEKATAMMSTSTVGVADVADSRSRLWRSLRTNLLISSWDVPSSEGRGAIEVTIAPEIWRPMRTSQAFLGKARIQRLLRTRQRRRRSFAWNCQSFVLRIQDHEGK